MECKHTKIGIRQAEAWAYDFHGELMRELPPRIRDCIDWEKVAVNLEEEAPEYVPMPIKAALRRIVESHLECATSGRHDRFHYCVFKQIALLRNWLKIDGA